MKSIIVTGANGQLGQELFALHSHFPSYRFHFLNRIDLDISCETEVRNLFADLRPDYCINCAAYTAVDKAEAEKKLAFEINATAVGYLAKASAFYNTRLIHISTDYVFDGTANSPYKEDNPTNPVGVYGVSKLAGEQLCLQADPSSIIIRTSWVYSPFGNNFVKTMIRLMQSKKELSIVGDQLGSPTYAADLAAAIMHINNNNKWIAGIYHFSNEGVLSWFDFAEAIREHIQSPCILLPITTAEYPTPARRPSYSVLDKNKIKDVYNLELKDWKYSLKLCLDKIRNTV